MRIPVLLSALVLLAACGSKEPAAKAPEKKREPVQAPAVYKVRMETTKGPIVVEVHRDWAPRGADHFYTLVTEKFFDGVKFHRVVRRFVAQFGINPGWRQGIGITRDQQGLQALRLGQSLVGRREQIAGADAGTRRRRCPRS